MRVTETERDRGTKSEREIERGREGKGVGWTERFPEKKYHYASIQKFTCSFKNNKIVLNFE